MGRRVLLVDDDARIRQLFLKILARGNYSVCTADSGLEALRVITADGPFDLLILDLCMPEPDGFEVLKRVRAEQPGLRVLVVSGFMDGALLEASDYLGATSTLIKSEAPQKLLQEVNRLLQVTPESAP